MMKTGTLLAAAVVMMVGGVAHAQYPAGMGYRALGGGPTFFPSGAIYNQRTGFSAGVPGMNTLWDPAVLNAQVQAAVAANLPRRASESIDASFDKGTVTVKWSGEPRLVQRIRFQILDKDRKVIKEELVTRLPAETKFSVTNKTAYYRTVVEYIDGTTNTVTSPL
jgi:hypothetical protein